MSKTAKAFFLLTAIVFIGAQLALHKAPDAAPNLVINDNTKVWEVMTSLGKAAVNKVDKGRQHNVTKGQQLVARGYATDFNGKKSSKIAPKLVCAACHTSQQEHPRPSTMNPQSRLEYCDSMDIPFLPGAPFFGLVNRVAFFTNDYQEIFAHKHNQDLKTGHRDIRRAIQACNTVYAKGRPMLSWEVESILAYLWTMELKMSHLQMPDSLVALIQESIETNVGNSRAVNLMRRYYPEVYPASLAAPIPLGERKKISPVLNSYSNGRKIYKRSCLHCHANKRYAKKKLDRRQKTFNFLKKHMDNPRSPYNMYDAIRYSPGSKANRRGVPHYTSQRMSDQQIQDLRFYILQKARLGAQADDYFKNY